MKLLNTKIIVFNGEEYIVELFEPQKARVEEFTCCVRCFELWETEKQITGETPSAAIRNAELFLAAFVGGSAT